MDCSPSVLQMRTATMHKWALSPPQSPLFTPLTPSRGQAGRRLRGWDNGIWDGEWVTIVSAEHSLRLLAAGGQRPPCCFADPDPSPRHVYHCPRHCSVVLLNGVVMWSQC